MDPFADKVIIVTGGASGLGRALCENLGRRGGIVIVADISAAESRQVARELTDGGLRVSAVTVDVADESALQRLVCDTIQKHGRTHYMFNNAGVTWIGNFQDMSLDHLDRVVSVNLRGVLYGTRAIYPVMVRQGFGHIVNIASMDGLLPQPRRAVAAATKHAIVGFSTSLNGEARRYGVTVSVVCPRHGNTNIGKSSDSTRGRGTLIEQTRHHGKGVDPATCATTILRGVLRKDPIITIGASGGFAAHRQGCFNYSGLRI